MAKTVFILGAGASRHAGAPLMNEFLERAWGLPATSNLGAEAPRHFALVRKGINALQLAHSKGDLDIWNLEAVFDAFEMAASWVGWEIWRHPKFRACQTQCAGSS